MFWLCRIVGDSGHLQDIFGRVSSPFQEFFVCFGQFLDNWGRFWSFSGLFIPYIFARRGFWLLTNNTWTGQNQEKCFHALKLLCLKYQYNLSYTSMYWCRAWIAQHSFENLSSCLCTNPWGNPVNTLASSITALQQYSEMKIQSNMNMQPLVSFPWMFTGTSFSRWLTTEYEIAF